MKSAVKGFVESHPVTFACLKVTPILPYRTRVDKNGRVALFQKSKIRKVVALLVIFFIALMNFGLAYLQLRFFLDVQAGKLQWLNTKTALAVIFFTLFSSVTSLTVLWVDSISLVNLLAKSFYKVDCSLHLLGAKIKLTKIQLLQEAGMPFGMILMVVLYGLNLAYKRQYPIFHFMHVTFCLQYFLITSLGQLGYVCSSALKLRFSLINKCILELKNSDDNKTVIKQPWVPRKNVNKIVTLRQCFGQLSSAVISVNDAFEKFWLMDILQMTTITLTAMARLINPDVELEKNITQMLFVAVSVVRLSALAMSCGDTTTEARKLTENLSIFMEASQEEDDRKEVEHFILIINSRRINFSACGLFGIDRSLIISVSSTVFAYLALVSNVN